MTSTRAAFLLFAPARDVPDRTIIVASVSPGHVEQYEAGTRVIGGDIVKSGEVISHVEPNDILVVEASGGERFGKTRVTRVPGWDIATAIGVLLLVGGTIASWSVAGDCLAAASNSVFLVGAGGFCLDFGFIGTAVAALIGGPILAVGTYGEIRVTEPSRRAAPISVRVAPNGLLLRF